VKTIQKKIVQSNEEPTGLSKIFGRLHQKMKKPMMVNLAKTQVKTQIWTKQPDSLVGHGFSNMLLNKD